MSNLIVININTDSRWEPSRENCIYIGRPSVLSNPYSSKKSSFEETTEVSDRETSLKLFFQYFKENVEGELKPEIDKIIDLLDKYDNVYLGCFCAPKMCHGNFIKNYVLLKKYNNEKK